MMETRKIHRIRMSQLFCYKDHCSTIGCFVCIQLVGQCHQPFWMPARQANCAIQAQLIFLYHKLSPHFNLHHRSISHCAFNKCLLGKIKGNFDRVLLTGTRQSSYKFEIATFLHKWQLVGIIIHYYWWIRGSYHPVNDIFPLPSVVYIIFPLA